jgi:hypothetical protein
MKFQSFLGLTLMRGKNQTTNDTIGWHFLV